MRSGLTRIASQLRSDRLELEPVRRKLQALSATLGSGALDDVAQNFADAARAYFEPLFQDSVFEAPETSGLSGVSAEPVRLRDRPPDA